MRLFKSFKSCIADVVSFSNKNQIDGWMLLGDNGIMTISSVYKYIIKYIYNIINILN